MTCTSVVVFEVTLTSSFPGRVTVSPGLMSCEIESYANLIKSSTSYHTLLPSSNSSCTSVVVLSITVLLPLPGTLTISPRLNLYATTYLLIIVDRSSISYHFSFPFSKRSFTSVVVMSNTFAVPLVGTCTVSPRFSPLMASPIFWSKSSFKSSTSYHALLPSANSSCKSVVRASSTVASPLPGNCTVSPLLSSCEIDCCSNLVKSSTSLHMLLPSPNFNCASVVVDSITTALPLPGTCSASPGLKTYEEILSHIIVVRSSMSYHFLLPSSS
mmetsp:Transcript_20264/g.35207  ORF Transcript_20264/g.35207 Transcript_20264/m.35207 type:complete len:271 (+) Transcript_20264:92-904(+)